MPPLILAAALLEGLSLTLIQGYLPLYVRRALGGTSYSTVALLVAVPALGTMIAGNFWGGLSDVTGRLKPMILVGLLGYAAALGMIPAFREGFGMMAYVGAASLLYGTLAPSLKTYVTLRRPERKEQALAYVLMAQSVGWFLGSFCAGWLLEGGIAAGMHTALWTCSALLAAHALLSAAFLRDERREPLAPTGRRGWLQGLAADLASLYENPRLLGLCFLAFFFVAGNYAAWGFFSIYMFERLGADIRTIRYALAASSLLGIVSFLYVGPLIRRFGGRLVLAAGITLYVVMYLGMALTRDAVVFGAFYALPLYSLVNVSANALASEYSRAAQRAGGLGVLSGTYALATIVGPVTGGLLADRFGPGAIPWLSFGFLLLAVPIAWFQVAGASRRRAESEEMHAGAG
jgi:predicted MFS family arabinose efflux permease